MLNTLKNLIKKLPFDFTKNQAYDRQTNAIIKKVCNKNSICLDIGCHKGEVLDIIISHAPDGHHFGFEPIPSMYKSLAAKYKNTNCTILEVALSNQSGTSVFNHVVSNPAYSGLVKRAYDRPNEVDEEITVKTERLDLLFDKNTPIDLIKIDVEGGELNDIKFFETPESTMTPMTQLSSSNIKLPNFNWQIDLRPITAEAIRVKTTRSISSNQKKSEEDKINSDLLDSEDLNKTDKFEEAVNEVIEKPKKQFGKKK